MSTATTPAEDLTYDVMTPDSGINETFVGLSAEEQDRQRDEWKAELAKTEEEIATLRQVLGSKVKHAHDLKRRLGVTVWKEFQQDLNDGIKTVRESQTYQKTAGAMGAVGEKTSSLFGGIGAKFAALKETPTFKSMEERVGGVVATAKGKMGGSGSNSTQDFDEALKEAEANGQTLPQAPMGEATGMEQQQAVVDPSQQQPMQA